MSLSSRGKRYRWMEKKILRSGFRRAEPERMISGWTASSRDSSKAEGDKAHQGSGQIRSELRMSSMLSCPGFCPRRAKIRPARFASLRLRAIVSRANVLPDIILSFSAGRCRQYLLLPKGCRRDERLRRVRWPRPLACGR